MRFSRALSGLFVVVAGGCLPSRDNPYDPANAPVPLLRVLDRTAAGGTCLENPALVDTWDEVQEGSRGMCLALDARGTRDPQATPLEDLDFVFERIGDAPAIYAATGTSGGAIALLDPDAVRDLRDGEIVTFRVTVRDEADVAQTHEATFRARNRRPVVTVDPPRTLPLHGRSWAGAIDEPVELAFHARATDADGDSAFTWRWLRADGSAHGVTTSNASFSIPTGEERRYPFYVIANDGDLDSIAVPAAVSVRAPNLWTTHRPPTSFDTYFQATRHDSDSRRFSEIDADPSPTELNEVGGVTVAETDGGTRVLVASDYLLYLATYPDLSLLDEGAVSATASFVGDSKRIWGADVVAQFGEPATAYVRAFRDEDGVLVPEFPELTLSGSLSSGDHSLPPMMAEDSVEQFWIADTFGENLWVVTATGSTSASFSPEPGTYYTGLAAGGNGEMWTLEGPHFAGGLADAGLVRHRWTGSAYESDRFSFGERYVAGLASIDEDRFWTFVSDRGLCVLDVRILEVSPDPDAAFERCTPAFANFYRVVVDPITHFAWWNSLGGDVAFLTTPEPGSDVPIASGSSLVTSVDPAGRFWFVQYDPLDFSSSGDSIGYGLFPSLDGVVLEQPLSGADLAQDGTGGYWLAVSDLATLIRVSETGAVSDVITELDLDGVVVGVPFTLAIDADGNGGLWVAGYSAESQSGAIYRVDVDAERTLPSRAPAMLLGDDPGFINFGSAFVASGPQSPTQHAWMRSIEFFPPHEIRLFRRNGDQFETFVVLEIGLSDPFDAAAPPASGDLCFARGLPGGSVEFQRAVPAATPLLVPIVSFDSSTTPELRGVAASSTSGEDEDWCWIAVHDDNGLRVLAYDEGGLEVRSFLDVDGDALDLQVDGRDVAWILRSDSGVPGEVRPVRIHFTSGVGEIAGELPPTASTQFIDD